MALELCVGDNPNLENPVYDCIQFAEPGKPNVVFGFSPEAQAAVIRLMKVITGVKFVVGLEDEHRILYWRKDLAEQIALFEQQNSKEE
jgi:hypothetical protein